MRVIKWCFEDRQEQWQTFIKTQHDWQLERTYQRSGQEALYHFIIQKQLKIDLAYIGLHYTYRNTFYALIPQVIVIIQPSQILQAFNHYCTLPEGYSEEVAVSVDDQLRNEWRQGIDFLENFYKASSVYEAVRLYNTWQLSRSLSSPLLDKLQLIIECFKDEIMTYFEYRQIVDSL